MLKITQISTLLISFSCLFSSNLSFPVFATSTTAAIKKDPCLKNNNGIGNNHNIYVELPTNSLNLNDSLNQIMSIRIDPGNSGQMALFTNYLSDLGFKTSEEINFVISQVSDAENKVKQNKLECSENDLIDNDYTLFSD